MIITRICVLNIKTSNKTLLQKFGYCKETTKLIIRGDENYVGPPNKLSNLRPIVLKTAKTALEETYNTKFLDLQARNEQFWTNHNKRFLEEKSTYIKQNTKLDQSFLSADEMSLFYKKFLDKNWKLHFLYNISWYSKNFELLFLNVRINIEKILNKLKR